MPHPHVIVAPKTAKFKNLIVIVSENQIHRFTVFDGMEELIKVSCTFQELFDTVNFKTLFTDGSLIQSASQDVYQSLWSEYKDCQEHSLKLP